MEEGDQKESFERFFETYNNLLDHYIEMFLNKDINKFKVKYNRPNMNVSKDDIEDIISEIKLALFSAVKKKYTNGISIKNDWNYTVTIAKNRLKSYLIAVVNKQKQQIQYEKEWEGRVAEQNLRKQNSILMHFDGMTGLEIRELFGTHLNIKQSAIVLLKCCGHSDNVIAELLKLSADYVRKLFKQAEHILARELLELQ